MQSINHPLLFPSSIFQLGEFILSYSVLYCRGLILTLVCYEISGTGELVEIYLETANMDSSSLYCFVDHNRKVIYFWKGRDASIRKKFIGAKAITDLRAELGLEFSVQPIDEGAEPYEFKTLLTL